MDDFESYPLYTGGPSLSRAKKLRMTKKSTLDCFRVYILPGIRTKEKELGYPDLPMRREAWNNFVDGLQKDGKVTREQVETWTNPY